MLAHAQALQLVPFARADPQRAGAHPPGIRVVENDNAIVRGQPEVAFDPRAALERGRERDQAVLRKCGAAMQAAMGESGRAGVERVRP